MEIKRIVKSKKEMYQVYFDDGQSLKVHEESLVRYLLVPGKELTQEEFETLKESLEYDRAYTSALKYISYKLRSVKELEAYLSEYYEQKLVRQTVYRLQDEGYLNDEAYAEAFRNTVFNTSDKGPMHLVRELKKQGISNDLIEKEREVLDNMIDSDRMNKLKDKFLRSHRGS